MCFKSNVENTDNVDNERIVDKMKNGRDYRTIV